MLQNSNGIRHFFEADRAHKKRTIGIRRKIVIMLWRTNWRDKLNRIKEGKRIQKQKRMEKSLST
jgi:hypothetical protein